MFFRKPRLKQHHYRDPVCEAHKCRSRWLTFMLGPCPKPDRICIPCRTKFKYEFMEARARLIENKQYNGDV